MTVVSTCMFRNLVAPLKGSPAKRAVPNATGVAVSTLGAISEVGVIGISVQEPQAASVLKKRRLNGKAVQVVSGRIGRRTEHQRSYLSNVIDVLGKK